MRFGVSSMGYGVLDNLLAKKRVHKTNLGHPIGIRGSR